MRVLFTATRGAGHFRPLLPYIAACLRAGHKVALAAPPDLADEAARAGAEFLAFGHPGDEALRPIWSQLSTLSADASNALVVSEIFARLDAGAALPALCASVKSWRPDVIVRESYEFAGALAGELLGVPVARVAVSLAICEEACRPLAAAPLDALRGSLGLPPDPTAATLAKMPYFTFFARSLEDPTTPGVDAQLRFREADEAEPPKALPESWWPGSTAPLVYITFGSVAGALPHARAAYRAALDAVATLNVRALLTIGHGVAATELGGIPSNVHVEPWVAQRDVLAHAAAVVQHGGSGTVTGVLAAGLPTVIVPLFADQPLNAARVAALGAGIAVSERPLTTGTLRAALETVLSSAAYRDAAQAVAREMSEHLPITAAVDELVRLANGTRPSA